MYSVEKTLGQIPLRSDTLRRNKWIKRFKVEFFLPRISRLKDPIGFCVRHGILRGTAIDWMRQHAPQAQRVEVLKREAAKRESLILVLDRYLVTVAGSVEAAMLSAKLKHCEIDASPLYRGDAGEGDGVE